jgi:PAS domain S-box-containing protein
MGHANDRAVDPAHVMTTTGVSPEADPAARLAATNALLQQVSALTITVDAGGYVTSFQDGEQIEEAVGHPLEDVLTPRQLRAEDGRNLTYPELPLVRALAGEVVVAFHCRRRARDGQDCLLRMAAVPIRSAEGDITGAMAIAEDITETWRLRRQLEERSALLDVLAKDAPIGFGFISWPDFRYEYANDALASIDGMTVAHMLGRTRADVLGEAATQLDLWCRQILETGQAMTGLEIEAEIAGKPGRRGHFLASYLPVYYASGEPRGLWIVVQDLTERRRQEAELQAALREAQTQRQVLEKLSERDRLLRLIGDNLRASLDASEVLRAITHALGASLGVGRVFYATVEPSAEAVNILTEYRREGTAPSLLGIRSMPAYRPVFQALARGETLVVRDTATDPRTSDKFEEIPESKLLRSVIAVPLREDGRWVSTLVVANSAPRFWTEEEVDLVEAIAERTRLAIENARLFQAERDKAQRLAEAFAETHHRVKNNLQVIASLLDMRLLDETEETPLSRQDLRRMIGNVRAIAAVHDFLSHNQEAMTVLARDVLKGLVPMASQTAGVTAGWQADDVVLSVKEGTALALILNELLSNAGKHGARRAQVSLRRDSNVCLLEVADDGPGFPQSFDPTHDAHQGLNLVTALAERDLQGQIRFGSAGAGGGRVCIEFMVNPSL